MDEISFVPYSRPMGSIFQMTMNAQFTGQGLQNISKCPIAWLMQIDNQLHPKAFCNCEYICKLYKLAVSYKSQDSSVIIDELKSFLSSVTLYDGFYSTSESQIVQDQAKLVSHFFTYGGMDCLLMVFTSGCLDNHPLDSSEVEIKGLCLDILLKLMSVDPHIRERLRGEVVHPQISIGEQIATHLGSLDYLLEYVLSIIHYDGLNAAGCQLLEDIVQYHTPFSLQSIHNLQTIINKLDSEKIASFSGFVGVVLTDLETYDLRMPLEEKDKQKCDAASKNIKEANIEFLLNKSDIILRVLRVLVISKGLPCSVSRAEFPQNWLELTEHSPSNDHDDHMFIAMLSTALAHDAPFELQPSRKVALQLTNLINCLFLLGVCLSGKFRPNFQTMYSENGLFQFLATLFTQFTFPRRLTSDFDVRRDCTPETSLKIQFLRLLHNLCDQLVFKYRLVTVPELLQLQAYNKLVDDEEQADPVLDTCDAEHCLIGETGLIHNLVSVIKLEPPAAIFRFWLSRAIESFLRCERSFPYQTFLIRQGLLKHLVEIMLSDRTANEQLSSEVVQSSFDLLSEVVKFNYVAFEELDLMLCTPSLLDRFVKLVREYPVDSNMFVRSLVLTSDYFSRIPPKGGKYNWHESPILNHVAHVSSRVKYARLFINQVYPIDTVTQENVSCLNTTITLLMAARRGNNLFAFLERFFEQDDSSPLKLGRLELARQFLILLQFWQDHYLHKDRDCSSLERSSRIKFNLWKETVAYLLDPDTSPLLSTLPSLSVVGLNCLERTG